ncbi:MAG: DUF1772 domain-containing protein [Methyloceanibacter sp.]|uniref:anthrone oxygenase family protein n=1 Tax=Methyloceanibacter sp. TaxID=1965321 RepID=UPI003D6D023E
MGGLLFVLTLVAALGAGLVAGIFFAFSAFIMTALGRIPAPKGIAAMQSINVAVLNPVFFTAFFGTGLVSLAVATAALFNWSSPSALYLLAGALLYIVGCLFVTMVFNVPLNNKLKAVSAESAQGASVWSEYLTTWTAWNTVRTIAPLAALPYSS